MRGSEIDKCLKNSIILELATKGGTDFILPDGTFKLMADKYKVKVDTRKRQREMAIFEDPLLDLNQFNPFKNINLAGGIVYKYNVHSRLALRGNFTYGKLEAYDEKAKSDLLLTAKQIAQQKKNKAKKTLKVDSAAKMIQSSKPDPETSIEGYLRIGKRQYT